MKVRYERKVRKELLAARINTSTLERKEREYDMNLSLVCDN